MTAPGDMEQTAEGDVVYTIIYDDPPVLRVLFRSTMGVAVEGYASRWIGKSLSKLVVFGVLSSDERSRIHRHLRGMAKAVLPGFRP